MALNPIIRFFFMFCCCVFFSIQHLHAQGEIGLIGGITEYSGDLAKSPFIVAEAHPGGSLFFKYYLNDKWSLKALASYGKISGNDLNKATSFNRNLSFRSNIMEFGVSADYDFLDFYAKSYTPYAYAGLALFHFDPEAELNGTWHKLQPLRTEGQGIVGYDDPYRLTQFSVPLGIGFKYAASERIVLYADIGARKTFTDHLDDVSRQEYVNPDTLEFYNGSLAREIAYRADEIGGQPYSNFTDPQVRADDPRNLSRKKDWYYVIGIGASYNLPNFGDKKRSLIHKNRRKVPYRIKK